MRAELTECPLVNSDEYAREQGEIFLKRGPAYSGIEDGKVIGSAGLMILWPGVAQAWILFSTDVENMKKFVYEIVSKYLVTIFCEHELRRVQAHCKADHPMAVKFLEQMGFTRECLMRKYGIDGSDHYLYSFVRD
jgi:RimJ/RimL family protein N-acetyltransferase